MNEAYNQLKTQNMPLGVLRAGTHLSKRGKGIWVHKRPNPRPLCIHPLNRPSAKRGPLWSAIRTQA